MPFEIVTMQKVIKGNFHLLSKIVDERGRCVWKIVIKSHLNGSVKNVDLNFMDIVSFVLHVNLPMLRKLKISNQIRNVMPTKSIKLLNKVIKYKVFMPSTNTRGGLSYWK